MHPRGPSTALLLAMIVLIAGLLTGCGGDQSGSASQQDGGGKAGQDGNAPKEQGKNAPEKKILFGVVILVTQKTGGFGVGATKKKGGKRGVFFRLEKESNITKGE